MPGMINRHNGQLMRRLSHFLTILANCGEEMLCRSGETNRAVVRLPWRSDSTPSARRWPMDAWAATLAHTISSATPEVSMNEDLERLAVEVGLKSPENQALRLTFGHACAARVSHLLEEAELVACLRVLDDYLAGKASDEALRRSQVEADRLAKHHPGSKSIDGCGHAAVSASHALANAVNGRALEAASYAAYAMVYAGGGYGAVSQPEAFETEFSWQLNELRRLAARRSASA